MTAPNRHIVKQFDTVKQIKYKNLVVSGCSFTWNNHNSLAVSWPYYLRDLLGFSQVVDCSQGGGGNTHIFNSIINELETNTELTADNTMIAIMWSGLERTDILADHEVTADYIDMPRPTYFFDSDKKFSSASIHNNVATGTPLSNFSRQYCRLFLGGARVTQSLLHVISLANYLENKKYQYVFMTYENIRGLELADPELVKRAMCYISDIETLGNYADRTDQRMPADIHPTIQAHLGWTREVLVPALISKFN